MWDVRRGGKCGNSPWTAPDRPETEQQEAMAVQSRAKFKAWLRLLLATGPWISHRKWGQ